MPNYATLLTVAAMIAGVTALHAADPVSDDAPKKTVATHPFSVRVHGGIFRVAGAEVGDERVKQMGVRAGYRIMPRLKLELGYNKWNSAVEIPGPRAVPGQYFYPAPGQLRQRDGFQMIDLNVATPLLRLCNHSLNAGLAASYTWGTNSDLVAEGPTLDLTADAGKYDARYFGVCPNLNYTYTIPGGRVFFGTEYMPRWYFGQDRLQHDMSLFAGFSF